MIYDIKVVYDNNISEIIIRKSITNLSGDYFNFYWTNEILYRSFIFTLKRQIIESMEIKNDI